MTKTCAFIGLLLLAGHAGAGHRQSNYAAGFKTVHLTDQSRIYKPGTSTANKLHFRQIDADIWYPAHVTAGDSTLSFKYFLDQYGARANFYTASSAGDNLPAGFAHGFCQGFKCSTPAQLFRYKTGSYLNAAPAAGKFPLVVYMASYGSMGYENYKLFEDLAKQGYITLSISSIGRYPGDMTMKNEDMLEQVNDALASLKYLQKDGRIDFSRIALLGYSWGGVGDALLAEQIGNVRCMVSFEGSEFHHYGNDKTEDADFDGIKNSAAFQRLHIKAPYLRLESGPAASNTQKDSVYDFTQKLSGKPVRLRVVSADHEDFCYIPVAVRASGKCNAGHLYNTISALTLSYLGDHLKGGRAFDSVMKKFIQQGQVIR